MVGGSNGDRISVALNAADRSNHHRIHPLRFFPLHLSDLLAKLPRPSLTAACTRSQPHQTTSQTNPDTHLSQIELSGFLVIHTLQLNQSGVGSRVPLSTFVTEDTTFDVETVRMIRSRSEWEWEM